MNLPFPLILDGGLSNLLEKEGLSMDNPLWSALCLITAPEAIKKAHLSYLHSGADCLITSSYQANVSGFLNNGYSEAEAIKAVKRTVQLAKEAILQYESDTDDFSKKYIAASIGPYGAFLADGSEYRGDYNVSNSELKAFHSSRISLLENGLADFFACETIPSFMEAKVLCELLKSSSKVGWISFSLKDEEHISDGTSLTEVISYLENQESVFGIGMNCSSPNLVKAFIRKVKSLAPSKKVIVYPNSGEIFSAEDKTWAPCEHPADFSLQIEEWIKLGADIIGGCCRIGPEHIQAIKEKIK
jgi:homocysteine S-methyltransferase